jgi:capsular polysaccharide biosynthesis protein
MRKKEVQVPASIRENVIQVSGDSLLLGHGLYQNYFNWILLYASNIALFQNSRGSTKLVTPKFSKSYVPGTLEFFGVRQDSVYQVERPTLFEQLTVLSPPAWGRYNISPVIIDTLRGHPRVRDLWNRSRNKIYVPRSNTKIRRVINEGELESCLQAQGFSIFDSASHSIFDQIRAFKNASVIVAAHGAGLANIVFCNPGAIIIELVPEGYDQGVTSYRSLADLFGLQYMQVLVPAVGVPPKGNPCNSDIHVPVKELMNILADL